MNRKPQQPTRPEKALVIRTGLKAGRSLRPGTKLPNGQVVQRDGTLSDPVDETSVPTSWNW